MCYSSSPLSRARLPEPSSKNERYSSSNMLVVAVIITSIIGAAIGFSGIYGKFSPSQLTLVHFKVIAWTGCGIFALTVILKLGSNWCGRLNDEKEASLRALEALKFEKKPALEIVITPAETLKTPAPKNVSAPDLLTPYRIPQATPRTTVMTVTLNSPLKGSSIKATAGNPVDLSTLNRDDEPILYQQSEYEGVLASLKKPQLASAIPYKAMNLDFNKMLSDYSSKINGTCHLIMTHLYYMGNCKNGTSGIETDKPCIDQLFDSMNLLAEDIAFVNEILSHSYKNRYTQLNLFVRKVENDMLARAKKMLQDYNQFHNSLPALMPLFTNNAHTHNALVIAVREVRKGTPIETIVSTMYPNKKPSTLFVYFLKEYKHFIENPPITPTPMKTPHNTASAPTPQRIDRKLEFKTPSTLIAT